MSQHFPDPVTKGIAQPYWEALKDGKFLVQECGDCHRQIFYPRVVCDHCGSMNVSYKEHSGRGEIYSFTVVQKTRHLYFQDKVPYVVALIDLEGGGRMMTNIVDCSIDDVKIGDQVQLSLQSVSDSTALPYFTLV